MNLHTECQTGRMPLNRQDSVLSIGLSARYWYSAVVISDEADVVIMVMIF